MKMIRHGTYTLLRTHVRDAPVQGAESEAPGNAVGVCTDGQDPHPDLITWSSHVMSMTFPSHKSQSRLKAAFANDTENLH